MSMEAEIKNKVIEGHTRRAFVNALVNAMAQAEDRPGPRPGAVELSNLAREIGAVPTEEEVKLFFDVWASEARAWKERVRALQGSASHEESPEPASGASHTAKLETMLQGMWEQEGGDIPWPVLRLRQSAAVLRAMAVDLAGVSEVHLAEDVERLAERAEGVASETAELAGRRRALESRMADEVERWMRTYAVTDLASLRRQGRNELLKLARELCEALGFNTPFDVSAEEDQENAAAATKGLPYWYNAFHVAIPGVDGLFRLKDGLGNLDLAATADALVNMACRITMLPVYERFNQIVCDMLLRSDKERHRHQDLDWSNVALDDDLVRVAYETVAKRCPRVTRAAVALELAVARVGPSFTARFDHIDDMVAQGVFYLYGCVLRFSKVDSSEDLATSIPPTDGNVLVVYNQIAQASPTKLVLRIELLRDMRKAGIGSGLAVRRDYMNDMIARGVLSLTNGQDPLLLGSADLDDLLRREAQEASKRRFGDWPSPRKKSA